MSVVAFAQATELTSLYFNFCMAGTSSVDDIETEGAAEAPGGVAQHLSGLEINLGDFTRTQGLMKSLRLLLNNQIVVPVEEIASGISEAGRKFKLGDLEQANQDVARLYSSFGQRVSQWEGQARGLEQQMKMQAAKNPKSISIEAMNRMKSEQTAVRTRIRTAEVQFRRLHQALDQAFTNFQRQPASDTSEPPTAAPPGFLETFKAATRERRSETVKELFEIESVLKVTVSRGASGGYDIRFDPPPPLDRLYFITTTAQIIRLQDLSSAVRIEDLETGQESELKLVEFVRHVQSGVWLLKSLSASRPKQSAAR